MANIPTNTQYQNLGGAIKIPTNFRYVPTYTPDTYYQNLAKIKTSGKLFTPSSPALPGTPEYQQQKQAGILKYGNLVNQGMGIPTQSQFLPPVGALETPIPIPSDYGTFAAPQSFTGGGENLSWGTPTTPVIRNIGGDVPGQYIEDISDPNLLVKTERGKNQLADEAIRSYRPGTLYQIDHIMPLELGGADTLANRQLLTAGQNDLKTRAQSIPYTLYAYGDISLTQAREMAMKWKDRDVTDVPQPNDIGLVTDTGGRTGIQIARDTVARWVLPKKKTLKEKIGEIPEAVKNFGEGWLPDPVREFIKGFSSGMTLGFLPYEQDQDEATGGWLGGKVGQVLGTVASFLVGSALISTATRASLLALRSATALRAAKAGFGVAKVAEEGVAIAEGIKTADITFKTLNKVPGYMERFLTKENLSRAGKMGVTATLVGQGAQFVENKFNPNTISGKAFQKDQENIAGNLITDLALGSLYGMGSPTLKGTAYAMSLPLTMGLWVNPDDPLSAITDAAVFGALHVAGTYKKPGFNNVKMFGGKEYQNPVTKAFEDTVNRASYSSLNYYAPDVLSSFKPTDIIPEAVIQKAKDTAIQNVWKRFFFGKDITPQVQGKALTEFRGFSKGLEAGLDTTIPELKGLSRLSYSARRARTAAVKAQETGISKAYGKDYQIQNELMGETIAIPEVEGMDLQTALTEIKRITVAARQLYKGGLTAELRNKADVDDLLSFSKGQLQGRFDTHEKFFNPPIVKQTIEVMKNDGEFDFMKRSFNNEPKNPLGVNAPFPNGDIAVTGAALEGNKQKATYFFQQKDKGNASSLVMVVDRSDSAPLWRMKNDLLTPAEIKAKFYAIDPNPENALQVFGIVKNPDTGTTELVELGWVASNFRLNEATGVGHRAINQNPAVLKYKETNGAEGLRPIDLNKDQTASKMKDEGIDILFTNLDPRATIATVESGNPFIPLNVNDANVVYSKKIRDLLSKQPDINPISTDIAKINNTINARQNSEVIAKMNKKIVYPVSERIPKPIGPINLRTDNVTVPRETTREVLQQMERSLDVAGPIQVKEAFKQNFGILLEDNQAMEIFNRRNEITLRNGVKLLVDAANKGNIDVLTKSKLQFIETYLGSGVLQATAKEGKAIVDMPILGKMKGITEGTMKSVFTSPVNEPTAVSNIQESVLPKTTNIAERESSNIQPSVIPVESAGGLIDKIVSNAQRELPNIKKKIPSITPIPTEKATILVKSFIEEGISALENAKLPRGHRYTAGNKEMVEGAIKKYLETHDSIISNIEKRLQADLRNQNQPPAVIKEATQQMRSALEKHSSALLDARPRVPEDFLASDLPEQLGITSSDAIKYFKYKGYVFEDPEFSNQSGGRYSKFPSPEAMDKMREYLPLEPPVPGPKSAPGEYSKFIQKGLATSVDKQPGVYYFAKAFDKALSSMLGPEYKKTPRLVKILDDYFESTFSNEQSAIGRELTQPTGVIEARGRADYPAEIRAFNQRNINLLKDKGFSDIQINQLIKEYGSLKNIPRELIPEPGTGGGLTKKEIADLGFGKERGEGKEDGSTESSGFAEGVKVTSRVQEENMIRDLTQGEDLISALFSSVPDNATKAVGAVNKMFLGYGKTGKGGLRQFILQHIPSARRSVSLDNLIKEAQAVDAKHAIKSQVEKTKLIEAKEQLPKLEEQLKYWVEAKVDPERPTWQTDAIIDPKVQDIVEKIEKYSGYLKDAQGGPGIHDGKGGFFANVWDTLKKPFSNTFSIINKPKEATYNLRGMTVTDKDLNEIGDILYGEISNRIPERQGFEIKHILNTAINRAQSSSKDPKYGNLQDRNKSLVEIMQRQGQYQGYAPKGILDEKGNATTSQYQLLKSGKINSEDAIKLQNIRNYLNQLKISGIEDTTGGKMYYGHSLKDGTLWLGDSPEEVNRLIRKHEKITVGRSITRRGTLLGLPIQ